MTEFLMSATIPVAGRPPFFCWAATRDFPESCIFLNQAAEILDALAASYPWYKGQNRAPVSVEMDKPEVLRHEKPNIVIIKFTLAGRYIAGTAADPALVPAV